MSTIQSRTPEKKAKNHVRLIRKLPRKSCSTTPLPFLSPNPKILKAFLKTFPTKMKPTRSPAKEKKLGEKGKSKTQDCCVPFKPKFCFLHVPELSTLIFCIWIRRTQSVRPVNGLVVSFCCLWHDGDQKTTRLASTCVFRQNLQGRMG